jgi:hypothetical protein
MGTKLKSVSYIEPLVCCRCPQDGNAPCLAQFPKTTRSVCTHRSDIFLVELWTDHGSFHVVFDLCLPGEGIQGRRKGLLDMLI